VAGWHPALLRYLKVIAPDFAEDVAAETWVSVIRGLDRFRGGEDAWRAWLFTTARRRAVDEGRRRSRRPESPAAEGGEEHAPGATDTVDQVLENLATREAVAAVASLPLLQAEVIMLRLVTGLDRRGSTHGRADSGWRCGWLSTGGCGGWPR